MLNIVVVAVGYSLPTFAAFLVSAYLFVKRKSVRLFRKFGLFFSLAAGIVPFLVLSVVVGFNWEQSFPDEPTARIGFIASVVWIYGVRSVAGFFFGCIGAFYAVKLRLGCSSLVYLWLRKRRVGLSWRNGALLPGAVALFGLAWTILLSETSGLTSRLEPTKSVEMLRENLGLGAGAPILLVLANISLGQ